MELVPLKMFSLFFFLNLAVNKLISDKIQNIFSLIAEHSRFIKFSLNNHFIFLIFSLNFQHSSLLTTNFFCHIQLWISFLNQVYRLLHYSFSFQSELLVLLARLQWQCHILPEDTLTSFYLLRLHNTNGTKSNERKGFHSKKTSSCQDPMKTITDVDYGDDLALLANIPG